MVEAAGTSETSVNFCQTTWRNSLEDRHLLVLLLNEMDATVITHTRSEIGIDYKKITLPCKHEKRAAPFIDCFVVNILKITLKPRNFSVMPFSGEFINPLNPW
jgi:hypothetical protein